MPLPENLKHFKDFVENNTNQKTELFRHKSRREDQLKFLQERLDNRRAYTTYHGEKFGNGFAKTTKKSSKYVIDIVKV